jgi:hypothetical protein
MLAEKTEHGNYRKIMDGPGMYPGHKTHEILIMCTFFLDRYSIVQESDES